MASVQDTIGSPFIDDLLARDIIAHLSANVPDAHLVAPESLCGLTIDEALALHPVLHSILSDTSFLLAACFPELIPGRIQSLRAMVDQRPNFFSAMKLGDLLVAVGRHAEAIEYYEMASKFPDIEDHVEDLYRMVGACLAATDFPEAKAKAIFFCEKILLLSPDFKDVSKIVADLYCDYADRFFNSSGDDFMFVLRFYEKALVHDETNVRAMTGFGNIFLADAVVADLGASVLPDESDDLARAESYFRDALAVDPHCVPAIAGLSNCGPKQSAECMRLLQDVLLLDQDNAYALRVLHRIEAEMRAVVLADHIDGPVSFQPDRVAPALYEDFVAHQTALAKQPTRDVLSPKTVPFEDRLDLDRPLLERNDGITFEMAPELREALPSREQLDSFATSGRDLGLPGDTIAFIEYGQRDHHPTDTKSDRNFRYKLVEAVYRGKVSKANRLVASYADFLTKDHKDKAPLITDPKKDLN